VESAARGPIQRGPRIWAARERKKRGGGRKQAVGGEEDWAAVHGAGWAEPKSSEGESITFSFLFPVSLFF